jgi:hypothetical protein
MTIESPFDENNTTEIIAIIIEILFGLVGALGMGWLYVGSFGVAALIFISYLIFCVFETYLIVVPWGLVGFCLAPLNLLAIAFSSYKLRDRIRQTGASGNFLYVLIACALVVGLVFMVLAWYAFLRLWGI